MLNVTIIALFLILFSGCYQKSTFKEGDIFSNTQEQQYQEKMRKKIIKDIDSFLHTSDIQDCSDFVSIINQKNENIYFKESELLAYFRSNSKADAIFNLYKSQNRVFFSNPKPADLIFFGNTTRDKNSEITHIGIVYKVDYDGTIAFANLLGKEIKISYLNLNTPTIHKIEENEKNSFLKKCLPKEPKPNCLASNFFRGYGNIFR